MLYELFSPYIERTGVLTTILAFAVDLINIPFMIVFLGIYVAYTALLSLTAFFARLHTVDLKLHFREVLKAVGLCAIEVSFLRFILAQVRMAALIGYRRKKDTWGRMTRQRIEIK